ncbi:MAG: hypothetical protein IJF47_00815 [Candidatus Methanomethylophilaceae archaeon]|nr:hypothetical protein [Candidatus Methanomethylophilaceae archaeon]
MDSSVTPGNRKKGKAVRIIGATSDAEKSITATPVCRVLSDVGYSVCLYKSQNVSLTPHLTLT